MTLGSASSGSALGVADGGTGQTAQTAAFDSLSPTTTKGDIIVDDGTNAIRVAIGTDDQVLTADSAQASGLKWAAAAAGGASDMVGLLAHGTMQWGFLLVSSSATTMNELGLFSNATPTDDDSSISTDADGPRFNQDTTNASGNVASYTGGANIRMVHEPTFRVRFEHDETTSVRLFLGLSSANAATMGASDDPSASYAGIQFSTNRSDTNYQWVTDDGTTQEITATSQAVASNTTLEMEMVLSSGSVQFKLFDNTGSQVGGTVTHTTNVPADATNMNLMIHCTTLTTAVRQLSTHGAACALALS